VKAIAFYTIKLLVQDVKDLVTKHVQSSIKQGLNNQDHQVNQLAVSRQRMLSAWEKSEFPLTWNLGDKGCYSNLLCILNDDPTRKTLATLQHSPDQLTYNQLASSFVTFASNNKPVPPLIKGGYFAYALPLALSHMKPYAPSSMGLSEFFIQVFAFMLKKLEIHFLPWKCPGPNTHLVQAEWWMLISCPNGPSSPSIVMLNGNCNNLTAEEAGATAAQGVADRTPSAPLSVPTNLLQMGAFWKKTCLPKDWDLEHASLHATRAYEDHLYVPETYEYVMKIYDGTKWKHHMALVWAIFFSHVLPYISFDKPKTYPKTSNPKDITQTVRNLPWVQPKSQFRRGVTAPKPYITMTSTMIIALMDPDSPLSKRASNCQNALGDPWTGKHGTVKEVIIYVYIWKN
jgi:hypothetical protein